MALMGRQNSKNSAIGGARFQRMMPSFSNVSADGEDPSVPTAMAKNDATRRPERHSMALHPIAVPICECMLADRLRTD
jgi:hypothetical protein